MKYSVKVNKVTRENSNIKGIVTIVFNDSFIFKRIRLVQGKNGQMFLSMPAKIHEVENSKKRVFKDLFNPTNKDFRNALTKAAIESYESNGEIKTGYTESGEEMPITVHVRPSSFESSVVKGLVSVVFDDNFVVKSFRYCETPTSRFLGMPSVKKIEREHIEGSKPQFYEFCAPTNKRFYNALMELVNADYSK